MVITKRKDKKFNPILRGRVWLFPDNVDTDAISPGKYLDDTKATLEHTCETINKNFPKDVREGDIIIAGRNFGCGSSRETAPAILQEKGIVAVIAESFARIFYRSSFALALPLIEKDGVSKVLMTGDEVEINVIKAEIKIIKTGKILRSKTIPPLLLNLLKEGGLEKQLLNELREVY